MDKKTLTAEQCKDVIKSLASSQGFYGRVYRYIESEDNWAELEAICEENDICDTLDLVLHLEGG